MHLLKKHGSLVLLAMALILSVSLVEGLVRYWGYKPASTQINPLFGQESWAERDPHLGWVNRPGGVHSVEPGKALMNFAKDHRRQEPAHLDIKPITRPAVLVVGGSYTQGYGVTDDKPYSYLLNRQFSERDFLNYGTGGYGTYQSLLRVERYFKQDKQKAGLVIYGIIGHHPTRNVAAPSWVHGILTSAGRLYVPPHVRLGKAGLVRYNGWHVPTWPLEDFSALVAMAHDAYLNWRLSVNNPEKTEVTVRLLQEMDQTVRKVGAELLVVVLAATDPKIFELFPKSRGFQYLDCRHPEHAKHPKQFSVGGHPNGKLHAYWADCIAKWLEQKLDLFKRSESG